MNDHERVYYAQMSLTDGITKFADVVWANDISKLCVYGVSDPVFLATTGRFVIYIDENQIVDMTAHLSEPEFHDHLLWLRARAGLQIVFNDLPDPDAEVDVCLERIAPGSHLQALSLVTGST